ncbi:uncharacterized protein LAESUDRAFT_727563 [Laetiporus sulphureus 93-53]|uniref:Zn(2)-C6 fungal-type domain-containing protein n=1 Tax=Laetiporus sulphureus 93-53 TaxID=1314785 RepID=A0A165DJ00_9APHY|nr:uncharacterized protein LAESUDRAFT_727563 [Laetiporus sulphureus 93-53]KZT04988.1 hypothetical protein LAESUDRAFT_727563 [Laetiporus sulphureus 93-53]
MPTSATTRPRADDKERTARAQEQEFKRARGAISCAECRRLKLKCDKTVPCSSCKRRGCSSICPNGSLTTGQGTRFILADTDRLHRKIAEMSDRIRQLEDALAILQSSVAREAHPLLSQNLLKIKSGLELHSAANTGRRDGAEANGGEDADQDEGEESQYIDAFGTLAVRDDGAATFYGRSAGSESLLLDEKPVQVVARLPMTKRDALPDSLTQLATSFPAAPADEEGEDLDGLIRAYLPPWARAAALCDLYLDQAPWFFGALTRRQLVEDVLPLFYEEAAQLRDGGGSIGAGALTTSSEAFNLPKAPSGSSSSHELALLFVVFCFGALTDGELPAAPHNVEAERYFQLTRAALNLEPVLERPPSVATVQTLSLMGIYQGLVADENSIESTWALMGLSSKLAQSIGLHRDCARWKLTPAEVQKRRALFWELFITDCWQALATGRLPTFSLPFVDTELPADPDETIADDGTPQPSFPAWKARWGKECVAEVVQGTLTSRAPKYTVILDLDRKLRDMPLPKYAQGQPPQGAGLSQTMSHFMPVNYLHLTLLYVHRTFFAQALVDHPTDPLRSQYAPSFLAGYRSACALLGTIREQFALFPVQIARFWVLWTHAFSASVMLASVVTHGGTTKTAQAALGELRLAYDLFDKAAKHGGRSVKFLPIIQRLHEKAYQTFSKGLPPTRDIFTPRIVNEKPDELSIFSGRTRTVATKSHKSQRARPAASTTTAATTSVAASGSGSSGSGSSTMADSPGSSASLDSPGESFPSLESYGSAVHPMLVDQMRAFHGELEVQIHSTEEVWMSQQRAEAGVGAYVLASQQQQDHQQQQQGQQNQQEQVQFFESAQQYGASQQYATPQSYGSSQTFDSPQRYESQQQQYESPHQYESPQQYEGSQQYESPPQYGHHHQQQYANAQEYQQEQSYQVQQQYQHSSHSSQMQQYPQPAEPPHEYPQPAVSQSQYDRSQQYGGVQHHEHSPYEQWYAPPAPAHTQGTMPPPSVPSQAMPPPPVPSHTMAPSSVSASAMAPPPVPATAMPPHSIHRQRSTSQLVSVDPQQILSSDDQHQNYPMYGVLESASAANSSVQYGAYAVPAPAPAHASQPVVPSQGYAAVHSHAQHAQSQLWPVQQVEDEMMYSLAQAENQPVQVAYQQNQSRSRHVSLTQGHYQYQMPMQMQPQPQPPTMLPVESGSYSLQESWTSFMQHELPGPVAPQPGYMRR